MTRGQFDGYGRQYTLKAQGKDYKVQCRVGYWKLDQPYGVSVLYEQDLKFNCSVIEYGIYYNGVKESDCDISQFKTNMLPRIG
jgi:hypothetical protein